MTAATPTSKHFYPDETYPIRVLLIDDQPIISEGVKRMLSSDPNIHYRYCQNPIDALKITKEFQPTVILQDLVMPDIDGLTLVKYLRADPFTKMIPLIVLSSKEEPELKAEAFSLGANDYLVKLPNEVELLARIVYHSNSYTHMLQRNEAYRQLEESEKKLQSELDDAAIYVKELIPIPIDEGNLRTDWRFIPSMALGGDVFGYNWLDDTHFAIYLLDVCGHGVGAALLSISIMNSLRSQALSRTDFFDPSSVLTSLNLAYQMERHNNMFFTIWYGVLDTKENTITFSSGGHPPPLLFTSANDTKYRSELLDTDGLAVGITPESNYGKNTAKLDQFNHLYLFSDGTYEVCKPTGQMLAFDEFVSILNEIHEPSFATLDTLINKMSSIQQKDLFEDDFSVVQMSYEKVP